MSNLSKITEWPKVSIVITAHNYAKFLPKAIDSALNQTYENFEIIVINDGSTDNTAEVLVNYMYEARIQVITTKGIGLAAAANKCIVAASGEMIIRLDADDWFDENILMVEMSYLCRHPNVGMVYCDFHTVDIHGSFIQTIRRDRINDEVDLLDRPCLAAGAMYRKSCWEQIGGYNEQLRYQEDYDFWVNFIERFDVRNLSLPLMYYRQHSNSMSTNWDAMMLERREIKHNFVTKNRKGIDKSVLVMIPARSIPLGNTPLPLLELNGQTLLERAVESSMKTDRVDRVIVFTEDHRIAKHAKEVGAEVPFLRSKAAASPGVPLETALEEFIERLRKEQGYEPDIIVICHPHSPFIDQAHIAEAIDSLLLYKTDSVIAVTEDLTYHWMVSRNGLSPVGYQQRVVREDKDIVFKESGSIYVVDRKSQMQSGSFLGERIGHIELSPRETFRIDGEWEYDVAKLMVCSDKN